MSRTPEEQAAVACLVMDFAAEMRALSPPKTRHEYTPKRLTRAQIDAAYEQERLQNPRNLSP